MSNTFYAARVWETGTLTATATVITLPNTAASISGDAAYQTFASAAPPTGSPVVATVAATTTGGAWEQSVWTYTSGSPGTLTRLTLLSSSTGAAINWSGVAASIMLDVPPPIVASAGAASAGLVPALGSTGLLDSSMLPVTGGITTSGLVTGQWYGMEPGTSVGNYGPDAGYIDFVLLDLQDAANLYSAIAINVTTAPTAATTLRLGIYSSIKGAPDDLIFDAGDITITATGVNSLSLSGCPTLQGKVWGAVGNPSTLNGMQITGYNQYGNSIYYKDLGALSPFQISDNTIGYIQSWTFGALPATAAATQRNASAIAGCQLQA